MVAHSEAVPVSEMNTTPLIDVLLVLLIMFIITIPIQTHSVRIDLPNGPPDLQTDPIRNTIVVTRDDRILWNGAAVDLASLAGQLDAVAAMARQPEVHLRPDPHARYETVDRVLAVAKRANVESLGFVGNEAYAKF